MQQWTVTLQPTVTYFTCSRLKKGKRELLFNTNKNVDIQSRSGTSDSWQANGPVPAEWWHQNIKSLSTLKDSRSPSSQDYRQRRWGLNILTLLKMNKDLIIQWCTLTAKLSTYRFWYGVHQLRIMLTPERIQKPFSQSNCVLLCTPLIPTLKQTWTVGIVFLSDRNWMHS